MGPVEEKIRSADVMDRRDASGEAPDASARGRGTKEDGHELEAVAAAAAAAAAAAVASRTENLRLQKSLAS